MEYDGIRHILRTLLHRKAINRRSEIRLLKNICVESTRVMMMNDEAIEFEVLDCIHNQDLHCVQ